MKINSGRTDSDPRIELIPLIDVIFCILTFFLLVGLQAARQQAINVDIPKAATSTPTTRELLMISLNDAGQIFIEQQPILIPAQLTEAVKLYLQSRPNSSIVLYASKQVSYDKVVEVLDSLRSVAGDRVALATVPTSSVAPTPPIISNPYLPYTPYQSTPAQPSTVAPPTGQTIPSTQVSPTPTAPQPSATPSAAPTSTPSKSP